MNTNFKILRDETFDYKNRKRFFLMLIKEFDRYAIEIVTEEKSYGRKFLKDKAEAEDVFEFLETILGTAEDYELLLNTLNSFKVLRGANEIKFIFTVYNKKYTQAQIGALINKFSLNLNGSVTPSKKMTIKVTFTGSRVSFGKFMGTFLKKDFIFKKT